MSKKIKKIFFIILMFCLFSIFASGEEIKISDEATTPQKTTKKAEIKTLPSTDLTVEIKEMQLKYEKLKSSLEDLKLKISDITSSLETIRGDIKKIDEKSLEIKNIIEELNIQKEKLQWLEDDYKKNFTNMDKVLKDYNMTKDSLKEQIDKMQSWDDILQVLKKEINNNELSIAQLKKSINELKEQYGQTDNFFDTIAKWPYLSLTAAVISIIAFFVAMAR